MNAMEQATFADLDYECKKRKTRREIFLERMDGLIPHFPYQPCKACRKQYHRYLM